MLKILKSLIIIIVLSSCSFVVENILETSKFHSSDKFLERFPDNKKSIIILKYSAKSPNDYLLWCKSFDLDSETKNEDCRKIYSSDSYKILMFEPGKYNLAEYEFSENQYIFQKPKKRVSSKNFLNFQAEVGKIIYAGFIKENGVKKHEIIDNFIVIKNALETRNYQELSKLFSYSLKDLEWLVKNYHDSPKSFIKELFEGKNFEIRAENNAENNYDSSNISCSASCDLEMIKKREREIEIDKEKYSKKYLQQLVDELNFDKKRCGIRIKNANSELKNHKK